jgi:hypothetical protein
VCLQGRDVYLLPRELRKNQRSKVCCTSRVPDPLSRFKKKKKIPQPTRHLEISFLPFPTIPPPIQKVGIKKELRLEKKTGQNLVGKQKGNNFLLVFYISVF